MEQEQLEEILALGAIFPEDGGSTVKYDKATSKGTLKICLELTEPLSIGIRASVAVAPADSSGSYARRVKHLPPIFLNFTLPEGYPVAASPQVCKYFFIMN